MESSGRDASAREGGMQDQDEFREDPRGGQDVSEQQPEVQPSEKGDEDTGRADREAEEGAGTGGESGRDDAGESTGNPPNAG